MAESLRASFMKGLDDFGLEREKMYSALNLMRAGDEHFDLDGFFGAGPTGVYTVLYE